MRIARLAFPILITLLLTVFDMAQEPGDTSNPSDIVVLEQSWRRELIDTQRDNNPLRPNEELMAVTRRQKAFLKDRDNDLPNQTTEPTMPAAGSKPVTPERGMWKTYVYKIKVKNLGEKRIKQLDWEYQFLDPDTQEVKEQRKITNRVKLSPGKSQVLERRLTRQPTVVVNAGQLGKKYKDQFTERAVITRIVYSDGSVWHRPKID